jgi:photosystem II stability/assembly factor-like uncharacterized protein
MGRTANDALMYSIAMLRPDEALHPEEAFGPDYLEHLVESAKSVSRSEVGSESRIHSYDFGLRRTGAKVGVLAVVVVLAAVSIGVWIGTNSTRSQTTQLSAWRAVDATFPTPFVREAATSPNMSEAMTCPTASTCYLEADGKGGITGYKSVDGGLNWASLAISDVSLSTRFSCPTARTCFAAGILLAGDGVHSVLVVTSDGGATWQTKPFGPEPVFDSLTCPSATTCVATVGSLNYGPNTVPQEDVYWSTDGGSSWREALSVPSGLVLSLSCPTVTTCIGLTYVEPTHTPTIESFRTSDTGYTWQSVAVGVQGVAFDAPSCADTSHCVAIVQTTPTPDPSVPGTLVALSSVDGGQSWKPHDLPANISTDALGASPSCPTDTQCWVSILLHQDQGSPQPVIAATTDGGQSWQQDPINDSCSPSGCIINIQTLQCPVSTTCLALGGLRNFHLPPVLLTNRPSTTS